MVQPWGQPPTGSNFNGLWTSNRDCGVSTGLSDGRRLWVFCDTSMFDQNLVHKSNSASNTAAFASWSNPLVLRDMLANGNVTQFIDPQYFYPCDGYRATWPSSVATLPDHDNNAWTDRVVVLFQNNCIHSVNGTMQLDYFEIGIAQYDYDARIQPAPMHATVINPRLFPHTNGQDYQFGGLVAPDGYGNAHLYAYSCGADDGRCYVRRVWVSANAAQDKGRMGSIDWWENWTGTGWSTSAAAGALFEGGGEARATGDGVAVSYVPAMGRYVMTYTPWPVFHSKAAIRTAVRPEGPWSPPTLVTLPGCESSLCYAANPQPQFADAGNLAISYLRWNDFVGWVPAPSNQGRIRVIKFPFGPQLPPRTATVVTNNVEFLFEIHNGELAYGYLWKGSWVKWFTMGSRTYKGEPAVVRKNDGRLVVFATDVNGSIWFAKQNADSSFPEPTLLADNIVGNGELAAAVMADGRLQVFATDATGRISQISQVIIDGAAVWSTIGFWPLTSTFRAVKGIAATTLPDGRVELFGADAVGRVNHTWHTTANDPDHWAGEFKEVIAGSPVRAVRGVAATNEFDGRVSLFVADGWGTVLHTWQNTKNGVNDWSSLGYWPVLGTWTPGGLSANKGMDGKVAVYAINQDLMTEKRAAELTANLPSAMSSFTSV